MAILNLTPDSFYAPSRQLGSADDLLAAAEVALAAGAEILDMGAESTRPGAGAVSPEEEQQRLLPALAALRRRFPAALLSVDSRHTDTARRGLDLGADIINDVTGLEDAAMAELIAARGCGAVLMHRRGDFASMHQLPALEDPLGCVRTGLAAIVARASAAGIAPEQIVLDPGFGFGKNLDENFPVLAQLDQLHALGYPLLAGVSRKSFLRAAAGSGPEERLPASLAAATAALLAGVHLLRVHDAKPTVEAARIADRLLSLGHR